MKTYSMAVLIIGLTIISASGFAQANMDRRKAAQRVRIAEGRRNGDVTNCEARVLHREQHQIHKMTRMARADGRVTLREKQLLQKQRIRANRHIHWAKSNPIDNN